MVRMNVSLSEPLFEELQSLIPPRQRSKFVAEAVRQRLALLRQEKALKASAGAWSNEGREEPETMIRASRRGWDRRLDAERSHEHDG